MATSYRRFQPGLRSQVRAIVIGKACLFLFVLVIHSQAQINLESGPPGAAIGPAYDVGVGYTYLQMAIPGSATVNFSGLDASGRVDLNRRWGAMVDSAYVRTSDVLNTGRDGYVLSLLAGPVFYPIDRRNTRVFVRALGGAGLVDAAVPVSGTYYLQGWVARPSYAVGGGIEQAISGRFAVRVSGDYLRTAFADSTGAIQPRSNLRLTGGVVLRLKGERR